MATLNHLTTPRL